MHHAIDNRSAPVWARADGLKTLGLLLALTLVASLVGWLALGGFGLLLGALVVVVSGFGLRAPDTLVMRLTGALPVAPGALPRVERQLRVLSARAGIAVPRLYLAPGDAANAMAVGRAQRSSVAVTPGLLRLLSERELRGVLAHELAHIAGGDTDTMRLAGSVSNAALTLVRYATWLALLVLLLTGAGLERLMLMSLLALVAPPLIGALRTALSRERELRADAVAAHITGDPRGLAYALSKLEWQARRLRSWLPLPRAPHWLSSHPDTELRIARLLQLPAAPERLHTPAMPRQRMARPRLTHRRYRW